MLILYVLLLKRHSSLYITVLSMTHVAKIRVQGRVGGYIFINDNKILEWKANTFPFDHFLSKLWKYLIYFVIFNNACCNKLRSVIKVRLVYRLDTLELTDPNYTLSGKRNYWQTIENINNCESIRQFIKTFVRSRVQYFN